MEDNIRNGTIRWLISKSIKVIFYIRQDTICAHESNTHTHTDTQRSTQTTWYRQNLEICLKTNHRLTSNHNHKYQ